jgi:L-aminopeptidase/D-esterase-like protein
VITAVAGIRVGHWTDPVGLTGCTVILPPPGTVASGEIRGGAPGTRETDLLRPGMLVQEANAILLTGGSAFGLAAADGVMRYLAERGIGFETPVAAVPIVPAAVLFDLACGSAEARPSAEAGYAACLAAAAGEVQEGNAGVGTGATVAKLRGPEAAVKGGLGTASVTDGDLVVAALAAVNALGEIVEDDGSTIAGVRDGGEDGSVADDGADDAQGPGFGNTTLVVVATNARLTKERANLLAKAAHEGISRAIRPSHTMWDGDTVFSLATGQVDADQRRCESLAEEVVASAIRRGVLAAESVPGFPAVRDTQGSGR